MNPDLSALLPSWMLETKVVYSGAIVFYKSQYLYTVTPFQRDGLERAVEQASSINFFDFKEFSQRWARESSVKRSFHSISREFSQEISQYRHTKSGANDIYSLCRPDDAKRMMVFYPTNGFSNYGNSLLCAVGSEDFVIMFSLNIILPKDHVGPDRYVFGPKIVIMLENVHTSLRVCWMQRGNVWYSSGRECQ